MTATKYKFTTQEYQLMSEKGIFSPEHRLELIRGEIVKMSPIGRKHSACIAALNELLFTKFAGKFNIWVQSSIRLDDGSEPQPDIALLRRRADFYRDSLPSPADILLIVEVADSTISYDRDVKMPLYAEFGIIEAWLIDLNAKTLTKYTEPSPKGYKTSHRLELNDAVLCLDIAINLTDIFGN
jgi:Uma2 family endonuclease